MKKCLECNERYVRFHKGKYVQFCSECEKEKKRENEREKYKKKISEKEKKKDSIFNFHSSYERCVECKNLFISHIDSLKLCSQICIDKNKIRKANEEWANKVYDNSPKPRQDEAKIAYSFFKKKYGIKSRYTVCRG
jgi:hypothetical protein